MAALPASAALSIALWLNLVMVLTTVGVLAVPVLAPAIAADLGIGTAFVGLFAGTVWGASLVTSLAAGGMIARFGAWRVAQFCLVVCALGLLAGALGSVAGLVLAAVLAGLGAGAETPTSSQLLAHSAPAAHRSTYFSIKQTGVQVGGMGTAVIFPAVALAIDWRTALAFGAAAVLLVAVLLEWPLRRYAHVGRIARVGHVRFVAALAGLMRDAVMRRLAAAAVAFGATQVCLNSFMVSYAVAERGVTLAQAGVLLAVAQCGGLFGRVGWGLVASRYGNSLPLLRALGFTMAACSALIGLAGAGAPDPLLFLLSFVFGLTASGWNGVFLAEIAHRVPLERVGAITGAIMGVMTLGLVAGPLAFASVRAASSYGVAYVALGAIAIVGTLVLPRHAADAPATLTGGT